jgi:hypothetical protein
MQSTVSEGPFIPLLLWANEGERAGSRLFELRCKRSTASTLQCMFAPTTGPLVVVFARSLAPRQQQCRRKVAGMGVFAQCTAVRSGGSHARCRTFLV